MVQVVSVVVMSRQVVGQALDVDRLLVGEVPVGAAFPTHPDAAGGQQNERPSAAVTAHGFGCGQPGGPVGLTPAFVGRMPSMMS